MLQSLLHQMGNIAFHEKSPETLVSFYNLSIHAMRTHMHHIVVADSALWMIANYFSFVD